MPIAKKTTYGLCKLKSCHVRFRKKNARQKFCCRDHKDTFYKRGEFPFEKMRDEIMRAVRAELAPRLDKLERWHAQLENGARESLARLNAMNERGGGAAA